MSHYYSSCQGGRGKATRCGHKSTGVNAMARCHQLTVNVTAHYDESAGTDIFDVRLNVDDPHALVENPDTGMNTNANTFHPLRIVYNRARDTVIIDHTVTPGECHNVTATQADFLDVIDY